MTEKEAIKISFDIPIYFGKSNQILESKSNYQLTNVGASGGKSSRPLGFMSEIGAIRNDKNIRY